MVLQPSKFTGINSMADLGKLGVLSRAKEKKFLFYSLHQIIM